MAFAPLCTESTVHSCKAVLLFPLFSIPRILSRRSPLAQGVGWVYFLLEVFTCTLELAGRSLKCISKQLFPLPIGAIPVASTPVPAAVAWEEAGPCCDLPRNVSVDERKVRRGDLWGRGVGGGCVRN